MALITPGGAAAMLLPGNFQRAEDGSLMFPVLRGLSLEFVPRPTFSTIVQTGTDRSTTRIGLDPYPLWEYDLSFGYVSDNPHDAVQSPVTNPAGLSQYAQLVGLFLACGGQRDTFLLDVSTVTKKGEDSRVSNLALGVGDGQTTTFQLVRPYCGFLDIVENPVPSSLVVQVTSNGVTGVAAVTSSTNGSVVLAAAPPAGAKITASFRFLMRMRFTQDDDEMDSMLHLLYSRDKLKIVQERNE